MGKKRANQPGYVQAKDSRGRTIWVPDGSQKAPKAVSPKEVQSDFSEAEPTEISGISIATLDEYDIPHDGVNVDMDGWADQFDAHFGDNWSLVSNDNYDHCFLEFDNQWDDERDEENTIDIDNGVAAAVFLTMTREKGSIWDAQSSSRYTDDFERLYNAMARETYKEDEKKTLNTYIDEIDYLKDANYRWRPAGTWPAYSAFW